MPTRTSAVVLFLGLLGALAAGPPGLLPARAETVPCDSDRWVLVNGEVTEHLGRPALAGVAFLEDVDFQNGVIEVEIAVDGTQRSYPGIVFRRQSPGSYERFYLRPHRSRFHQDALQYTPVFNGIAGWQLYHGEGFTAGAVIPADEWLYLKIEVKDTQARVFFRDRETPALVITDLKHGISRGAIGLMGQGPGPTFFSNFRYELDGDLEFPPAAAAETPYGTFTEWELSQAFPVSEIDFERTPAQQGITDLLWQQVRSEPGGLVDVARFLQPGGREPECVWIRKTIPATEDQRREFAFGYSDQVSLFCNGQFLFSGNSAYRSRDPSFTGLVGLNDSVVLPLRRGDNELLMVLAEQFGGWGFLGQDIDAVFRHPDLTELWTVAREVKFPEAVVFDRQREILYVSNYFRGGNEFISRVKLDGEIADLEWVAGLNRPTGLCLRGDKLLVVERASLVEIDIPTGQIENRFPFPQPGFPNDVCGDERGNVFVSDTRRSVIYRCHGGEIEVWLEEETISDPNGLCLAGEKLLVGNSGDGTIKQVDLATREVSNLVELGPGSVMDGIRSDGGGNFIISDFNGRVFRVTPAGVKTLLLDSTAPQTYCADLEFIPEQGLLIIPTLYDSRLIAFRLDPGSS